MLPANCFVAVAAVSAFATVFDLLLLHSLCDSDTPKLFSAFSTNLFIRALQFQVVLWQDQEDRGGEEAPPAPERARHFPHPRLRVQEERLLALCQGRRHRQALPHQAAGRGRVLHRQEDHFQDAAGAGRALQQGRGRAMRQPQGTLHSGKEKI